MKKTYTELGLSSSYKYPSSEGGTSKKMIVSDTISSLNVINGENNHIKDMICQVDNIGKNIKLLEDKCFMGCSNLRSVSLTHPLETIGTSCFTNCTSLTSFDYQYAYGVCDYAFYNTKLTSINFDLRKNLTDEDIYNNYDYEGCIDTLPNVGPHIGGYVFANCTELLSVAFPTSTTLGNSMFEGCSKLTSVTFSNHGQCVGRKAFKGCVSLSSIELPRNFEMFSESMFEGCTSLSLVTIPEDAPKFINICDNAFSGCTNLLSITLPQSINDFSLIADNAFQNSSLDTIQFKGINSSVFEPYVGKVQKKLSYGVTTELRDWYSYGSWFGGDNADTVVSAAEFAFSNGIPVFMVICSKECSYCNVFHTYVVTDSTFQSWVSQQPYIFIYASSNYDNSSFYKKIGTIRKDFDINVNEYPICMTLWVDKIGGIMCAKGKTFRLKYDSEAKKEASHQQIQDFISNSFMSYQAEEKFKYSDILPSEKTFEFWGINDGTKLYSQDNVSYTYNKENKWLTKP